jgi:hypothetical protein
MFHRRRKQTRAAPKARDKAEKCVTKWCRNRRALKITYYKKPDGTVVRYESYLSCCWKCRSHKLRERHPATYVLNAIRQRAKARKIPFTITLNEFKKFCEDTRYLELRGRDPNSLTIDRIDHDKGYHIWNIQVKSFYENCVAGHTVPGKETKQNERKPDSYDYDFNGPCEVGDPDGVDPVEVMAGENEPF